MHRILLLLLGILVLPAGARAVSLPIQIDGQFDDWPPAAEMAQDAPGDDGASGIDFTKVSIANDAEWVYIRFDTGVEVQPDEQQSMVLYFDTDQNPSTGLSFSGVGAELVWELGARDGARYPGAVNVNHPDIGLVVAPTVSNTQFEIALRRDATPGGSPLFGARFDLVVADAGGDRIPDSGGTEYTFAAGSQPTAALSNAKVDPDDIRIASYNVQNDGLFNGGSADLALDRIFDAVNADVWVLCEVWNHDASEVAVKVEQFLPSGPGESWHAVKEDSGNVIVSRFPILQSWNVLSGTRVSAARLDLRPTWDSDLLLVACHLSCCTADQNRQEQVDALVEFLADARTPGGIVTLAEDTPIVAAGDFNLVGWRQQLDTILTGDIVDNGTFGPDSAPDWDGTDLAMTLARHPDQRLAYTWRNDFSSFYPGQLDYVFYTDSAVQLRNAFVVETRTMSASTLSAWGLLTDDTIDASDHAPTAADFALITSTGTSPATAPRWGALRSAVPNPFNPRGSIRFALEQPAQVELDVYDARGGHVITLWDGRATAGDHDVTWDGRNDAGRRMPSGVYHIRMKAEGAEGSVEDARPVVLLK